MSPNRPVRRRTLLGAGAALGAAGPLALTGPPAAAVTPTAALPTQVRAAVTFLGGATDAHGGQGARLAQSFSDASGLQDTAFVYDNAVAVMALLAGGDLPHAEAIGAGLLFTQAHDPAFDDGRWRQGYHAAALDGGPGGTANPGADFGGSAVGDVSWAGIALAQLAHRTGKASYLAGSVAAGRWIHAHTYSTTGLGGYTFGETAGLEGHKSTEHNVDVYAYFRLLASLTGHAEWTRRAQHAWAFVAAMWNSSDGYFFTGSDDGAAVNTAASQRPLDVQTWSWLAARNPRYAGALDWARTNLATTDTPLRPNSSLAGNTAVSGVAFASGSLTTDPQVRIGGLDYNPRPNPTAVWFEGTSQLALALSLRAGSADEARAVALLAKVHYAQVRFGGGQTFGGARLTGGVVAASSPMDTGFRFGYFPNLHVGATAWYVLAATRTNPYRFV